MQNLCAPEIRNSSPCEPRKIFGVTPRYHAFDKIFLRRWVVDVLCVVTHKLWPVPLEVMERAPSVMRCVGDVHQRLSFFALI